MRRFRDDRFLDLAASPDSWSRHNRALRDAFRLLAVNLGLTALAAWWAKQLMLPPFGISTVLIVVGVLVVYVGLLFALLAAFESRLALLPMFALSAVVGVTLGPVVEIFSPAPDGGQVVMTAFAVVAGTFLSLSVLAVRKRRTFSMVVGVTLACILAGSLLWLADRLLELTTLSLLISAALVIVVAGHILYQTNRVVEGRPTLCIPIVILLQFGFFRGFFEVLQALGDGMA